MKRTLLIVCLLILTISCISFAEEPEKPATLTELYTALPDNPTDEEFNSFYTNVLELARFGRGKVFQYVSFDAVFVEDGMKQLALEELYEAVMAESNAYVENRKGSYKVCGGHRAPLKERLVTFCIPEMLLEARPAEGASPHIYTRQAMAYYYQSECLR